MSPNKIWAFIVASSLVVNPASASLGNNDSYLLSSDLTPVLQTIRDRALSVLTQKTCQGKSVNIQYVPLVHDFLICDRPDHPYSMVPWMIRGCREVNPWKILCDIEILTRENVEFCLGVDANIWLEIVWRRACK